jgi:ubiquitin C-terminal hydrolase
MDDNYFEYILRGAVIHQGSADSGHYYSFINEND